MGVNEKTLFGWFPINPLMVLVNYVARLAHAHPTHRSLRTLSGKQPRKPNFILEPCRLPSCLLCYTTSFTISRLHSSPPPYIVLLSPFVVRYLNTRLTHARPSVMGVGFSKPPPRVLPSPFDLLIAARLTVPSCC